MFEVGLVSFSIKQGCLVASILPHYEVESNLAASIISGGALDKKIVLDSHIGYLGSTVVSMDHDGSLLDSGSYVSNEATIGSLIQF